MFCPTCGCEYNPGITVCADCGIPLIAELPPPPQLDLGDLDLVTVLSTPNAGEIALVRSLLEEADIPFMVKNEGVQDLFGLGRLGGYNPFMGSVHFRVKRIDIEIARQALAYFIDSDEIDDSDD